MNKKFKYTSVAAAGLVTLGLVGGTFAYFTSSDTETNSFLTGKAQPGVDIVEDFEDNSQLLPGVDVNKVVQIHNTANYPQFIKVNFEIKFYATDDSGNKTGDPITTVEVDDQIKKLDPSKVLLNFAKVPESNSSIVINTVTDYETDEGKWLQVGEDKTTATYYYIGKVAANTEDNNFTSNLLDSVTLDISAGDEYKNLAVDVEVIAKSVQAAGGAYGAASGWELTAPAGLVNIYEYLEDTTAPATEPLHLEITE